MIDKQTIVTNEKAGDALGKKSFKYAFVMDDHPQERNRGVTISVNTKEFETENKIVTLVDCPGHHLYLKNAIHGMSTVGFGMIVLAAQDFATPNMSVEDMSKVAPNALNHLRLLRNFLVNKVIIGINKVDEIDFKEQSYKNIVSNYEKVLVSSNFSNDVTLRETKGAIPYEFLPYSAFHDINIQTPAAEMPWYQGPTLLGLIDSLKPKFYDVNAPAVAKLTGTANPPGKGLILTATIISGIFKPGMKVIVKPAFKELEIKSIQSDRKTIPQAKLNDAVGFSMKGSLNKNDVSKDTIVSQLKRSPKVAETITCKIRTEPDRVLSHKSDVQLYISTGRVSAVVEEIISIVDPKLGKVTTTIPVSQGKKEKMFVPGRRTALVRLRPTKPTICSKQGPDCIQPLSRVILNDGTITLAMGVVTDYKTALVEVE
jgi:elongation factor 1-alpha